MVTQTLHKMETLLDTKLKEFEERLLQNFEKKFEGVEDRLEALHQKVGITHEMSPQRDLCCEFCMTDEKCCEFCMTNKNIDECSHCKKICCNRCNDGYGYCLECRGIDQECPIDTPSLEELKREKNEWREYAQRILNVMNRFDL